MGKLLFAQVDHAHGEVIGHAMGELFRLGVKNAQLLQSMTKKNRPSYVFMIDLPDDRVEDVAMFLGLELGIWGYHLVESNHVHFDVSFGDIELLLTGEGNEIPYQLTPKFLSKNGKLLSVKVDYWQLVEIQRLLKDAGYTYSLDFLRAVLETRIRQNPESKTSTFNLPLSVL